ncbi:MAG: VTT domain-containing protein [Candidatus Caenarcaniphilales bacterium]|jgi:membrane-associated protein|nr:VTT domain-containing protein [Candidatus Caenarcaniphilales bacterium]
MHDLKEFIELIGYPGIFAIIFAESCLIFFLPGDTLLFTAGLLASQNLFSLPILLIGCFIAAVLGNNAGYFFGKKFGRNLFENPNSKIFKKKHLELTEEYYNKHGAKTIVLARFMPIIRTFAPVVAGIALMNYKTFFIYNLVGALLWAIGVTVLGYFLGTVLPDPDKFLLPIVGLIFIASLAPALIHWWQEKKKS